MWFFEDSMVYTMRSCLKNNSGVPEIIFLILCSCLQFPYFINPVQTADATQDFSIVLHFLQGYSVFFSQHQCRSKILSDDQICNGLCQINLKGQQRRNKVLKYCCTSRQGSGNVGENHMPPARKQEEKPAERVI